MPVLEEGGFCLPESEVIMEYLEERWPEPPLLPADPAERALARLAIFRFEERLGDDYYALRREEPGARALDARLAELDAELEARPFLGGREFGLADIAYVPWVLRSASASGSRSERARRSRPGSTGLRSGRRSRPRSSSPRA